MSSVFIRTKLVIGKVFWRSCKTTSEMTVLMWRYYVKMKSAKRKYKGKISNSTKKNVRKNKSNVMIVRNSFIKSMFSYTRTNVLKL